VSFAAITLCAASRRVFIVVVIYFVMTQSGSFWIDPRITYNNHQVNTVIGMKNVYSISKCILCHFTNLLALTFIYSSFISCSGTIEMYLFFL
jgi:type III secretory pathway component EscU